MKKILFFFSAISIISCSNMAPSEVYPIEPGGYCKQDNFVFCRDQTTFFSCVDNKYKSKEIIDGDICIEQSYRVYIVENSCDFVGVGCRGNTLIDCVDGKMEVLAYCKHYSRTCSPQHQDCI